MRIRRYDASDEEQVIRLWQISFPNDPPRNEPRSVIQRKLAVDPELFLVGESSGRVIATALGGYDGFRGWVYHLAITPERRREGLARQMMGQIEARLAARGCPKLNLQVRTSNAEVIAFYESLGYSVEENVGMGKLLEGSQ